MSNKVELKVQKRKDSGKGAARATRREGLVPAVVYGNKQDPEIIAVAPKDLLKQMKTKGFKTRQFELELDGKKELALCQAVQYDKLTDSPIHVDFLRIDPNREIAIEIPFVFEGEASSPALKAGGVLNIIVREARVLCKPADIVDGIAIDVSKLDIGESIHSDEIALPKGIKFESHEPFAIATTSAAVEEVQEEAPAAAPAAEPPKDAKDSKSAPAGDKKEEKK
ncbi:MAG: 50S ribosomal protein L25/general stress protein Ctc [Rickettsiales bacterium]|jgi:large subunit ribosomal protein L25|nr:50S ribosomal protein L25/general stress protein Ctc [Rickettsiales bacterium]